MRRWRPSDRRSVRGELNRRADREADIGPAIHLRPLGHGRAVGRIPGSEQEVILFTPGPTYRPGQLVEITRDGGWTL